MKQNRHYLNALCHFGPCHAYKQKVWRTVSSKLTYRVTKVLLRVNCIKQTEVLPHSPVATGVFDRFSPSETKLQSPPNLNMKHYKTVMFVQILECQAQLHKCKAPLAQGWAISGPGAPCGPPQRFLWPAEAFRKNHKIWKFLQLITGNVNASANLTDTCFYFY